MNILFYGEPGAGKTYLAGTADDSPLTSPVLFLDVEGGTMTIRDRPNVDVIQVRSMGDIVKAYERLANIPESEELPYKTLVIDSLTELQKLDMRELMDALERDKGADRIDKYVPTLQAWGKSGERLRVIIRAFRDLRLNTIATALLTETHDDRTGRISYAPSLPGKLRGELPGFFDIVGHLRSDDEKEDNVVKIVRRAQFVKTTAVTAKDRTNCLDHVMENPTIPAMWAKISST